ncbi:Inositol-1-monophosphatase ImpA [Corynebacterium ciconiae DSM 44920]|uniref:inositol monophosphatase family protein n=1 Tax=Corynebacterium ciconiae TaxID=227319 RepID=UPI00036546CC|nr:inositol monophosphatase [Corynebacterium ciconiae]WKD60828.1 Inositol-1-monophosphatase ImpA [Corynebacterium ciconiae DSM 44920]
MVDTPDTEYDAQQLEQLRRSAERILQPLLPTFRGGLGSPPAVKKAPGDFATAVDLQLERTLSEELSAQTGISCAGEEFGAVRDYASAHTTPAPQWVIDPIDGTSNYSAGNPQCAILVSLIAQGSAVIGLTALPATGELLSATVHSGVYLNGVEALEPPEHVRSITQFGFGSIVSPRDSRFPTELRHRLLGELITRFPRLRITGSVGVDLAYTALGRFGGAVSFSPHPWDNAAGCVLNIAAGNVVTDLAGTPWRPGGIGMVAATPRIHEVVMDVIRQAQ